MRNGIREFQPRQPLDRQLGATTLNQILRELESLRITRVVNGTFRKLPGGTEITVAPQRGGGTSAPATRQPWDLIAQVDAESDPENPDYLLSVQPGTLNGILPSNWDTEGINGAKNVEANNTGLFYAKAIIETDGTDITDVNVKIDTSPPATQALEPFALSGSVEYLFGLFSAGSTFRVIGHGNITLQPMIWLTTERDTPAEAGELPYQFFYRLQ
jgi:hypothetical protein